MGADFETTTKADDCRVWSWGYAQVDDEPLVVMGTDIDDFMHAMSRQNANVYFHNLKFDGHFILYWLLTHGYTYYGGESYSMKHGRFTALIDRNNTFYSITVRWNNGTTTEFRDSTKKFPGMSIAGIARTFKMDEGKGDLDYEAERPIGYQPTDEEWDYLRRDVSILCRALHITLLQGLTKLTIGSDSLAEYKKIIGVKTFGKLFPVLPDVMDAEIRRAYRGGYTYAAPRFQGIRQGHGLVLDVNSLYPSVMRNALLPYGFPTYQSGEVVPTEDHPLTIFSVTFTAKLKPNHLPCIQIKGSNMFIGTEYLEEIVEPTTLMVTNVDWDLYMDHYDIEIHEFGGGWLFQAVEGVFDEFIDKWAAVKANSEGGERELAKLTLNNLYGKFATNPSTMSRVPTLEDGKVRLLMGPEDTRKPVYTAMGVFITSYARDLTIRAAQSNYDTFAYADTDSLHLLTDEIPEALDIHPTRMGAWKMEYTFSEALYIRAKRYMELIDWEPTKSGERSYEHQGEYVNRVAGLPHFISSKLTFDDMYDGAVFHGKLMPRVVPGGVILVETDFEIHM